MTRFVLTEDAFLAQLCWCGHTRAQHRRPGSLMTAKCWGGCEDGHYFRTAEHTERDAREAALRADPAHVHGSTHEAIACGRGGFSVVLLLCDDCGAEVGRR